MCHLTKISQIYTKVSGQLRFNKNMHCLFNETGNIAIVAALCLTILLGMLALVVDGGYLYSEKNRFQNGVESAALAGAINLCEDDPEKIAREIAEENNIPYDEESLVVEVGFYDNKNEYNDFSEYKDFTSDIPEGDCKNAVMVRLVRDVSTLTGGFVGKDEVTIGASAVAYRIRYGMLSLGDEGDDKITTELRWEDGYPQFEDMGIIHANNDINFIDPPTISGNTYVMASGSIYNYSEGITGVRSVENIRPIDWEKLRADAEENGRVITINDFPAYGSGTIYDSKGNSHTTIMGNSLYFGLHDGNHGDATYYFSDESAPEGASIILTKIPVDTDVHARNFTIASDLTLCFRPPNTSHGTISMGGEGQDTVFIYGRNNIDGGGMFNSLTRTCFDGVLFRTEENFTVRVSSTFTTHFLRVIAKHKITIQGHFGQPRSAAFNGLFGPPCGPAIVKLGRLVTTSPLIF